jgi:hypothetical protein
MTATAVQRAREGLVDLLRLGAALAWVLLAAVAALAGLGAIPGWLAGETHEVRLVPSVEAAERWVGAPVALPSYYPERLAWPPAEIRVAGGVGGAVALRFAARTPGGPPVELLQAATTGTAIPAALLSIGAEVSSSRTNVGGRPAVLARVLVEGQTWEELRWERDGRAMVARTRGDLDELLRMAHSAHLARSP